MKLNIIRNTALAAFMAISTALQAKEPGNVTFALVGDIMMGTTFPEVQGDPYLPANQGRNLFDDVRPLLVGADVAAGNLEGVLLEKGVGKAKNCVNPTQCFVFRMPPSYVRNLSDAGFDLLSIANNHANDFGATGVSSTMKTLKEARIMYSGNPQCLYAIVYRGGKKIGYAAFGHSRGLSSIMDLEEMKKLVSKLDKECDIVVVSFHGGGEGKSYTHVTGQMENFLGEQRGNVREFAHAAVDAGADVVYGHGPHVTRGMELYKDRLIAYSLGNFATPYRVTLTGISGHAPVLTLETDGEGRFVTGKVNSFIQQRGRGPMTDLSNSVARQIANLRLPRVTAYVRPRRHHFSQKITATRPFYHERHKSRIGPMARQSNQILRRRLPSDDRRTLSVAAHNNQTDNNLRRPETLLLSRHSRKPLRQRRRTLRSRQVVAHRQKPLTAPALSHAISLTTIKNQQ